MNVMINTSNTHCSIFLLILSIFIGVSCDDKEKNEDVLVPNIPAELCGKWYQVMTGSDYYKYIIINKDGTIDASYDDDGSTCAQTGTCYYYNNLMRFNCKSNYGNLYNDDLTIVEWSTNTLILGEIEALFFSRNQEDISEYPCNEIDIELCGKWVYHQSATATNTVHLYSDRTGYSTFKSSIEHRTQSIVNWFVRNNWVFIKYDGDTDYTLYRYNKSDDTLYLYYADALWFSSNDYDYDYHRP